MISLTPLFEYDFLIHALLAGTVVAVLAGSIGYFIVLRNLTFASHALSHVGFAGATGAGLIGFSPWAGQLSLTLIAAVGIGVLGERASKSDIAIGVILAFCLGIGVLFLHLYTSYPALATAVLFGNLLGVSSDLLKSMSGYTIASLVALAIIARPLLFASLEPELAEAKGVSLRFIALVFMLIVAVAITEASQVVGVLLVFTLTVGPAAAALNWSRTLLGGLCLTVFLAVTNVWFSLTLAFLTDSPVPFWMSSFSLLHYLLSLCRRSRLVPPVELTSGANSSQRNIS